MRSDAKNDVQFASNLVRLIYIFTLGKFITRMSMLLSFPYFQGLGCTVILQPLAIELLQLRRFHYD